MNIYKRNWWNIIKLEPQFVIRQVYLIAKLALLSVLVSTAMVGWFYRYLVDFLFAEDSPLLLMTEDMVERLAELPDLYALLLFAFILFLLVNFIVAFMIGVIITQRLGGPAYKLKTIMQQFNQGDRGIRIYLRKQDELPELANELNRTMEYVQQSDDYYLASLNQIEQLLADDVDKTRLLKALDDIKKQSPLTQYGCMRQRE